MPSYIWDARFLKVNFTLVDTNFTYPHLTLSATGMGMKLINFVKCSEWNVEVHSSDQIMEVRIPSTVLRSCEHGSRFYVTRQASVRIT